MWRLYDAFVALSSSSVRSVSRGLQALMWALLRELQLLD
jgi:hypothetical protein